LGYSVSPQIDDKQRYTIDCKELSWKTFTPRSIGSLLIKSINGGLPRGVPVVNNSPSIGAPNTLVASQRLVISNER